MLQIGSVYVEMIITPVISEESTILMNSIEILVNFYMLRHLCIERPQSRRLRGSY